MMEMKAEIKVIHSESRKPKTEKKKYQHQKPRLRGYHSSQKKTL